MKAKLYIAMTSGGAGPEIELTDEQVQKVIELVAQLGTDIKSSISGLFNGLNSLSPQHYIVSLLESEEVAEKAMDLPFISLNAVPGSVAIYWKVWDSVANPTDDTVGLWPYLNSIAGYALHEYVRNAEKQIDAYYRNHGIEV